MSTPAIIQPTEFTVEMTNTIDDLLYRGPFADIVRPAPPVSSSGAALSSLLSGPERYVRAALASGQGKSGKAQQQLQGSADGQHWYPLACEEVTVDMTTPVLPVTSFGGNWWQQQYLRTTPECHITLKHRAPDGKEMEMSFVGRMDQVKVDTPRQGQAQGQEKKEKKEMPFEIGRDPRTFATVILSSGQNGVGVGQTIGYERATIEREAQEKRAHPTYPFYGATRVETLTPQEMSAFLGQVKDVVPLPVSGQEHLPLSSVFHPGRTSGALREEPQPQQKQKRQAYTHTFTPGGDTIRGQSFDMIVVDETASLFPSSFPESVFSTQVPASAEAVREEESFSSSFSSKPRSKPREKTQHEKSVLRG